MWTRSGSAAPRDTTDQLYREYCLALMWPRTVPEYIPDSVVWAGLLDCAGEPLPWAIDRELFWI